MTKKMLSRIPLGRFAEAPADRPGVQEQACVQVVGEIDQEPGAKFLDFQEPALLGLFHVLVRPALAAALLEDHLPGGNLQHHGQDLEGLAETAGGRRRVGARRILRQDADRAEYGRRGLRVHRGAGAVGLPAPG